MTLSPAELDELERLVAAATDGPWINGERILAEEGCIALQVEDHADIYRVTEDGNCNVACATFEQQDADCVVALRNAAPSLLAMAREHAKLREWLRHFAVVNIQMPGQNGCGVCESTWQYPGPEVHAPGCLVGPSK